MSKSEEQKFKDLMAKRSVQKSSSRHKYRDTSPVNIFSEKTLAECRTFEFLRLKSKILEIDDLELTRRILKAMDIDPEKEANKVTEETTKASKFRTYTQKKPSTGLWRCSV